MTTTKATTKAKATTKEVFVENEPSRVFNTDDQETFDRWVADYWANYTKNPGSATRISK